MLPGLLAQEQRAFLGRANGAWEAHLGKAREFFGRALQEADPGRPVLVLGAGSGLEIPWKLAPKSTVGWDADPWSRCRTSLRHRRFPAWIFEDLTGGLEQLESTARRARTLPLTRHHRPLEQTVQRLCGLLPSLRPSPQALRAWIDEHHPGTILSANVMGQFGCVAQSVIERALDLPDASKQDLDVLDPLWNAMDAWLLRSLDAFLDALDSSGAALWMIHDRAVIWGNQTVCLGPLGDPWMAQLRSSHSLEVHDPLCGLDVREKFSTRPERVFDRWLWPVGEGQVHVMEALAYSSI